MTPPLRIRPDMPTTWSTTETGFDEAAQMFVSRHRNDGVARDQPVADLRTWGFRQHDGHLAVQPLGQHRDPLQLRAGGLSNLCARLAVPVDFLRRMPAPLQLATLNWSLCDLNRTTSVTLRTRDDEVQAVVSERYAPLDADELVTTLRQTLVQHGLLDGVRVRAVATGMTDALRITFPEREVEAKVGDITHAGLDISSSSFGRSALHVRGLLFRLVCLNGLRVPTRMGEFSARHIGETQRLRDFLADAVPAAMAHSSGLMDSWRRAVAIQIDDIADVISAMRDLSVGERQLVEQGVSREAGVPQLPESTSLYNLINGVTGAARELETARRLELESMAGAFLVDRVRLA
jgi:hypothetical protein